MIGDPWAKCAENTVVMLVGYMRIPIRIGSTDRLGFTVCARHVESFRHSVNSDHTTRAKHPAALDGPLRDRPATPHRNSVAGLDFRILRGHIPGREDVREEKDLSHREGRTRS